VLLYLFINEKKNNLAWYQRTYFNIVKSLKILVKIFNFKSFLFIFIILLFLKFFVFDKSVTYCFNKHLNAYHIGGHILYFSGEITYLNALNTLGYIKTNPLDYLNCGIFKPNQLCINTFPYTHPYRHPTLTIFQYSNKVNNIFVNFQMSSYNFNNCYLLSNFNVDGNDRSQYISNNLYLYPKDDIKKYFYTVNDFKNNFYLDHHKDKINEHINSVINKYRV
jgi:hypothetical protein